MGYSVDKSEIKKNGEILKNQIDQWEQRLFVGRERELAVFDTYLTSSPSPHRIINLYGTGGMGKSYLLEEFRRSALRYGVLYLLIDSRDITLTKESFCRQVLHLLASACATTTPTVAPDEEGEVYIRYIHELIGGQRLIIALDTYEEMGSIQYWLRETFMVNLKSEVMFVISGRLPLQQTWSTSPAWARLILGMPIKDLEQADVMHYLDRCAITDDRQTEIIWHLTKGHPLTLSLLAATPDGTQSYQLHRIKDTEILPHVIRQWLLEVPNELLRVLVEGAAVARIFNEEFLSIILENPVSSRDFEHLTRLSFVRRMEHGWIVHDLVRDGIQRDLQLRKPQRFEEIRRQCILYYCRKLISKKERKQMDWESSELFYYLSDALTRSCIYEDTSFAVRFEAVRKDEIEEVRSYLEKQRSLTKVTEIKLFDSVRNRIVDYSITPEMNTLTLKPFDHLDELLTLGSSVLKVARNEEGEIVGLSIVIPIHRGTLSILSELPFSRMYFQNLSEEETASLSVNEEDFVGWCLYALHVSDFGSVTLRSALAIQLMSYWLAGGLLVSMPPPIPYVKEIHQRLGIEYLDATQHYDYGPDFPAAGYTVDTRGERMVTVLDKLLRQAGVNIRITSSDTQEKFDPLARLTSRERDVARLLVEGSTNKEIAAVLFLSEISVKKHLTSIFRKFDVKNRMQLIVLVSQF